MNWKAFITVFASAAIISFPQNIIGCGGEINPYDYYTSFFHHELPDAKGYRPFFYSNYLFLYDENEPVSLQDVLCDEWVDYCGADVKKEDVSTMLFKFDPKDLSAFYFSIEKKNNKPQPDSVTRNSMARYFTRSNDLEALGYILFAKKAEPYVSGDYNNWEPMKRDSLQMSKLIKNGLQLYTAAKKELFKLKYAFQVQRLAHYSGNYADAIRYYDDYVAGNNTKSVLQQLCISLKAGALFRTGKANEAAYLFSKSFSGTSAKRISNYLGFNWSVRRDSSRESYYSLCKNDREKADMILLFALGSPEPELKSLQEIFRIYPQSEALDVLCTREINKYEDKYFTPFLRRQNGTHAGYYDWQFSIPDSEFVRRKAELAPFSAFLEQAAAHPGVNNPGLLQTAAAYCHYMSGDQVKARQCINEAQKMKLTAKVKDQLMLTNILVTINEKNTIDAVAENELLPSIEWLRGKAMADNSRDNYWDYSEWKSFYRNLMSEILAKRYHDQGDLAKETLALGAADFIFNNLSYLGGNGIDFLRNRLSSSDVEKLYALMDKTEPTKFEKYLFTNNSVRKSFVIDFAGTAYLREYDFGHAIDWFRKGGQESIEKINKNPFIDLLNDVENELPADKGQSTSKLAFAQEMQRLTKLSLTDNRNAAKHLYKIATGMYNMTYYGHTWELVQYDRSGSDGYYIPKDATAFQKEYYGCYSAMNYFRKAMEASSDKNFKARCLFMIAKCGQKQVQRPRYEDYSDNWDQYEAAEKKFYSDFVKSPHYKTLFTQYRNTPFYKEAYKSCSYLRDFINKK